MADKIIELKKDIAELEALHKQATRVKVRDILSIETRKLVSEVVKLEDQEKTTTTIPTTTTTQTTNKCYLVTLNNYAWDQSNKFVKFYVTLQKVHTLPVENITCTFTNKSLELNVKGLENKDYVLKINKLLYVINPDESTWKVKTGIALNSISHKLIIYSEHSFQEHVDSHCQLSYRLPNDTADNESSNALEMLFPNKLLIYMVIINAAKKDHNEWSHVTEIEKRASDSKKLAPEAEKSDDPSEGLLNIVKNMYQQGDDELKRTITKAWTESLSKGPAF